MTRRSGRAAQEAQAVPGDRLRRHDVKRDVVLAAAVALFNAKGFRATSLDDVAARLGVTKPTIYHYVASKDDILFDCVARGLDMILRAAKSVPQDTGTGRDRLQAVLISYALAMTQDFCRCVTRTADTELGEESRRKFRALKRDIDMAIRHIVKSGMDDGSIRRGDVRLMTFTLTGALNWIGRWYEPSRGMTPEDVARGIVDTLIAGLAPGQAARPAVPGQGPAF